MQYPTKFTTNFNLAYFTAYGKLSQAKLSDDIIFPKYELNNIQFDNVLSESMVAPLFDIDVKFKLISTSAGFDRTHVSNIIFEFITTDASEIIQIVQKLNELTGVMSSYMYHSNRFFICIATINWYRYMNLGQNSKWNIWWLSISDKIKKINYEKAKI